MMLEFPGRPGCTHLDRQYMLGDVAARRPGLQRRRRGVVLSPGRGPGRTCFTGETRQGGRWYRERYDFMSLPLFVRQGSIVAIGAEDHRPDYAHARDVSFHVYPIRPGQSGTCALFDEHGEQTGAFRASWDGDDPSSPRRISTEPWRAVLHGVHEPNGRRGRGRPRFGSGT